MSDSVKEEPATVRFTCEECDWVHEVPPDHVVMCEDGIVRSDYVPFHSHANSMLERSVQYMNVHTKQPGYHLRVTLK
jgi:hypothetical protein